MAYIRLLGMISTYPPHSNSLIAIDNTGLKDWHEHDNPCIQDLLTAGVMPAFLAL